MSKKAIVSALGKIGAGFAHAYRQSLKFSCWQDEENGATAPIAMSKYREVFLQ